MTPLSSGDMIITPPRYLIVTGNATTNIEYDEDTCNSRREISVCDKSGEKYVSESFILEELSLKC